MVFGKHVAGLGFFIVRGGIDPGDHRSLDGVEDLSEDSLDGIGTYPPLVAQVSTES